MWFGPPHKSGVCRLPTSPSLGSVPPPLLPRAQVEVAVLRAWQGGREGRFLSPRASGAWPPVTPSVTSACARMGTKLSVVGLAGEGGPWCWDLCQ